MMNDTNNPNQGEREMDFKSAKIEGKELWIVWNDQETDQGGTIYFSEEEVKEKSAKIEGQELWVVWNDQGTDQGATIHFSEEEAKKEAESRNDEAWSKFE